MTKLIAGILFVAWMYAAFTANWTMVVALTAMIVMTETI